MSTKFADERLAAEFLEKVFWPKGPACCTGAGYWVLKDKLSVRSARKKCKRCDRIFSVRELTPFKNSKIPLHKCLGLVVMHYRHGSATAWAMKKELGIAFNTAKHFSEFLDQEDVRSQLSRLVVALQPDVAVPLFLDPTARHAPFEPQSVAPRPGSTTTRHAAPAPNVATTASGGAIARAS